MEVKTSDRVKRKYNVQKVFLKSNGLSQSTKNFLQARDEFRISMQAKSRDYEDAWYQSSMIQAADNFAKKQYIRNEMTLNQYREHERKTYGTINA